MAFIPDTPPVTAAPTPSRFVPDQSVPAASTGFIPDTPLPKRGLFQALKSEVQDNLTQGAKDWAAFSEWAKQPMVPVKQLLTESSMLAPFIQDNPQHPLSQLVAQLGAKAEPWTSTESAAALQGFGKMMELVPPPVREVIHRGFQALMAKNAAENYVTTKQETGSTAAALGAAFPDAVMVGFPELVKRAPQAAELARGVAREALTQRLRGDLTPEAVRNMVSRAQTGEASSEEQTVLRMLAEMFRPEVMARTRGLPGNVSSPIGELTGEVGTEPPVPDWVKQFEGMDPNTVGWIRTQARSGWPAFLTKMVGAPEHPVTTVAIKVAPETTPKGLPGTGETPVAPSSDNLATARTLLNRGSKPNVVDISERKQQHTTSSDYVGASHPIFGFGSYRRDEANPQIIYHPVTRQIFANGKPTAYVMGSDNIPVEATANAITHPDWQTPTYFKRDITEPSKPAPASKPATAPRFVPDPVPVEISAEDKARATVRLVGADGQSGDLGKFVARLDALQNPAAFGHDAPLADQWAKVRKVAATAGFNLEPLDVYGSVDAVRRTVEGVRKVVGTRIQPVKAPVDEKQQTLQVNAAEREQLGGVDTWKVVPLTAPDGRVIKFAAVGPDNKSKEFVTERAARGHADLKNWSANFRTLAIGEFERTNPGDFEAIARKVSLTPSHNVGFLNELAREATLAAAKTLGLDANDTAALLLDNEKGDLARAAAFKALTKRAAKDKLLALYDQYGTELTQTPADQLGDEQHAIAAEVRAAEQEYERLAAGKNSVNAVAALREEASRRKAETLKPETAAAPAAPAVDDAQAQMDKAKARTAAMVEAGKKGRSQKPEVRSQKTEDQPAPPEDFSQDLPEPTKPVLSDVARGGKAPSGTARTEADRSGLKTPPTKQDSPAPSAPPISTTSTADTQYQADLAEMERLLGGGGNVVKETGPADEAQLAIIGTRLATYHVGKGVTEFEAFARAIKKDLPKVWDSIKGKLRGFWEAAAEKNPKIQEVTRADGGRIIEKIDAETAGPRTGLNEERAKLETKLQAEQPQLWGEAEAMQAKAKTHLTEFAAMLNGVARELGLPAPSIKEKSVRSVAAKVLRRRPVKPDYNVATPQDHVRGAIYLNTWGDVARVVPALQKLVGQLGGESSVEEPMNKFGYRGLMLSFRWPDGVGAEIQLHTADSWALKKRTDDLYVRWRNVLDVEIPNLSAAEQKQLFADQNESAKLWADYWAGVNPGDSAAASAAVKGLESIKVPTVPEKTVQDLPSRETKTPRPTAKGAESNIRPSANLEKRDEDAFTPANVPDTADNASPKPTTKPALSPKMRASLEKQLRDQLAAGNPVAGGNLRQAGIDPVAEGLQQAEDGTDWWSKPATDKREFPSYTTDELRTMLQHFSLTGTKRVAIQNEIARRESGESKPKHTPQVIGPAPTDEPALVPGTGNLIRRIQVALFQGQAIDNRTLDMMAAAAFGATKASGKWTSADAYDAAEAALNKHLLETAPNKLKEFGNDSAKMLAWLRTQVALMPRQTARTAEKDAFQQFSTPPTEAYLVALAAKIKPGDVFLEPSAGVGSLAIWAKIMGATVHVNEIAPRRAALLRAIGFENVTAVDGEALHDLLDPSIRPTVIGMNPPFSATGGRVARNKTAYGAKHVEQALWRLADGGRLVAIVGEGMGLDKPRFSDWWQKMAGKYTVRANIGIPGEEYGKFGTTFGNQLLVFDKTGPTAGVDWKAKLGNIIHGGTENLESALARIESVPDRRAARAGVQSPEAGGPLELGLGEVQPGAGDRPGPVVGGGPGGGGVRPGEGGTRRPASGSPQTRPETRPATPAPSSPGPGLDQPGGRGPVSGSGGTPADVRPGGSVEGSGQPSAVSGQLDKATYSNADEFAKRKYPVDSFVEHPDFGAVQVKSYGDGRIALTILKQGPKQGTTVGRKTTDFLEDMGDLGTAQGAVTPPAEPPAPVKREDEAGGAFVKYAPAVEFGGKKHPADLVESASMAAVEPVQITATPAEQLRQRAAESGMPSDVQLEAIALTRQRHSQTLPGGQRAGVAVGAGTGVGKGIVLAGGMADAYHQDGVKRFLWLSVSNDLIESSGRDLKDVGLGFLSLNQLNEFGADERLDVKMGRGVIFATYSTLIAKSKKGNTRLKQIVDWLGNDGYVVFDEGHKAANALAGTLGQPTQTGLAVIALQDQLPKLRVVYSSATQATEARHLAYMPRLGLWGKGTPFATVQDFIGQLGDAAAMEMVARDMKALGTYWAPMISYQGVTHGTTEHTLTPAQEKMQEAAARAWQSVMQNIDEALGITNSGAWQKMRAMSVFWSSNQRFWRTVLAGFKMPTVIQKVDALLKDGNAVVIMLEGTGEARTKELVNKAAAEGEELDALDFTPRETLGAMIEAGFPTQLFQDATDPSTGQTIKVPVKDADGNPVHSQEALAMKQRLLDSLSDLQLPDNPLDQLRTHYGENFAEISGRKKVLKRNATTGKVEYVKRAPEGVPGHKVNTHEASRFMDGKALVAGVTPAGSVGITLHSWRRAKNQRRRAGVYVELPWSATIMVQKNGRIHRSDLAPGVQPPHFEFIFTNVGGEKRFVSSAMRRMGQLGSLSRGERSGYQEAGNLSEFNLETVWGEAALTRTYQNILSGKDVPGLADPRQALKDMGILKEDKDGRQSIDKDDMDNVTRFLNRVLALPLREQNALFDYFSTVFDQVQEYARQHGLFDEGVSDIKGDSITMQGEPQVVATDAVSGAKTRHVQLAVTNPTDPLSWSVVAGKLSNNPNSMSLARNDKSKNPVLVERIGRVTDPATGQVIERVRVWRPSGTSETMPQQLFDQRYTEATKKDVAADWEAAVAAMPKTHTKTHHVITGALLPIWRKLRVNPDDKLRIVRVKTDDGQRVVGVEINSGSVAQVLQQIGVKVAGSRLETPAQVSGAVLHGETVNLVGGLTLRKGKVGGEDVIKVEGAQSQDFTALRDVGLLNERKDFKQVFWVPSADTRHEAVLGRLLDAFPVVESGGGKVAERGGGYQSLTGYIGNVNEFGDVQLERLIGKGELIGQTHQRTFGVLPYNNGFRALDSTQTVYWNEKPSDEEDLAAVEDTLKSRGWKTVKHVDLNTKFSSWQEAVMGASSTVRETGLPARANGGTVLGNETARSIQEIASQAREVGPAQARGSEARHVSVSAGADILREAGKLPVTQLEFDLSGKPAVPSNLPASPVDVAKLVPFIGNLKGMVLDNNYKRALAFRLFRDLRREHLHAVLVDGNGKVLAHVRSEGGVNWSSLPIEEMIQVAENTPGGVQWLLGHNHPSGKSDPSFEDVQATSNLRTLFKTGEIMVAGRLWTTKARVEVGTHTVINGGLFHVIMPSKDVVAFEWPADVVRETWETVPLETLPPMMQANEIAAFMKALGAEKRPVVQALFMSTKWGFRGLMEFPFAVADLSKNAYEMGKQAATRAGQIGALNMALVTNVDLQNPEHRVWFQSFMNGAKYQAETTKSDLWMHDVVSIGTATYASARESWMKKAVGTDAGILNAKPKVFVHEDGDRYRVETRGNELRIVDSATGREFTSKGVPNTAENRAELERRLAELNADEPAVSAPTPDEAATGNGVGREAEALSAQMRAEIAAGGVLPEFWKRVVKLDLLRKSGTDTLRQIGGEVGKRLAPAYEGYVDTLSALAAKLWTPLERVAKPWDKATRKAVFAEFENILLAREAALNPSPSTDRELERRGIKGQTADQLLADAKPETRRLVAEVKSTVKFTGEASQDMMVYVWQPGPGGSPGTWRPIGTYGEEYWPRVLRDEVREILDNPNKNPSRHAELLGELMEKLGTTSSQIALQHLKTAMGYNIETGNDYMSNLELARLAGLPQHWYEHRFERLMPHFITGWSRRISQIKHFGQHTHAKQQDLFDTVLRSVHDRATEKYVKEFRNRVYEVRRGMPAERAMQALRAYTSATKLANWWTAIRNSSTVFVNTIPEFGLRAAVPELIKLHQIGANIRTAREAGVLRADLIAGMAEAQEFTERQRKAINLGLKIGGFTPVEVWTRATSAAITMNWARWNLARMDAGNGIEDRAVRLFLGKLKKLGVDIDQLRADGLGGLEGQKLMRLGSENTQFAYDLRQTPLWADHPAAKFLFQFQKFGLQQWRRIEQDVFAPAFKGYRVGDKVTRDFGPLLYFLALTLGTGAALLWLRELLFGKRRPDAPWKEVGATWDENKQRAVELALTHIFHDAIYAGGFGIVGDWAANAEDFTVRTRGKSPLNPPGLSVADNLWNNIVVRLKEQGKLTLDDLANWAKQEFPAYNYGDAFTRSAGAKFADAVGQEWDAAKRQQIRADIGEIKRVSNRYLTETQGEGRTGMSATVTPRTPLYNELQDALLLGDVARAEKIKAEILAEAKSPAEKAQALTGMQGSVRNRRPLKVGGAEEERSERLAFGDWLQRRRPDLAPVLKELDARYLATAHAVGLGQHPMAAELADQAAAAQDKYGLDAWLRQAVIDRAARESGIDPKVLGQRYDERQLQQRIEKGQNAVVDGLLNEAAASPGALTARERVLAAAVLKQRPELIVALVRARRDGDEKAVVALIRKAILEQAQRGTGPGGLAGKVLNQPRVEELTR